MELGLSNHDIPLQARRNCSKQTLGVK